MRRSQVAGQTVTETTLEPTSDSDADELRSSASPITIVHLSYVKSGIMGRRL